MISESDLRWCMKSLRKISEVDLWPVTGLGDGRICRSRTRLYDTWIFFTVVVSDPSSRLRLNSSLARMSLANILQVEAALKGSMLANV